MGEKRSIATIITRQPLKILSILAHITKINKAYISGIFSNNLNVVQEE